MKAKAPEKLYVDTEDRLSDSILYGFIEKRKDDDIEYVRKDAFIEKADKFINSFFHPDDTELNNGILDEFHKYMKGE